MQRYIIFLSLFIGVVYPIADNNPLYFDQATQALAQQKYAMAKELYAQCSGNDAAIWFNCGIIALGENDNARAKLYFLRAQKYWPLMVSRARLLDALIIVDQKLSGLSAHEGSLGHSRIIQYGASIFHAISLLSLQIIFLIILLILAGYLGYTRILGRNTNYSILIGLFIAGVFCGIVLILRYSAQAKPYGVMLSSSMLYGGPGDYASIGELRAGETIRILKKEGQYVKIGTSLGSGWVEAPIIEMI